MEEKKYANCFVCGKENSAGLQLDFDSDSQAAWTWFDSPSAYEGYHGIIHGGIIATLLDEAMAKIILVQDLAAVTADLSVRYRKSLPVGTRVKAEAKITQQKSRTIRTEAVLSDINGTVYAEANAVYIVVKKL
jgi:uncharacterized protein (TIGR00369 family)